MVKRQLGESENSIETKHKRKYGNHSKNRNATAIVKKGNSANFETQQNQKHNSRTKNDHDS